MRFIVILLFVILGNIFSSYAGEIINNEETKQNFADAVREKRFTCNKCTQAEIEMIKIRNKNTVIASVVCDDGSNSYTVTLKPNGKIIVENTTL